MIWKLDEFVNKMALQVGICLSFATECRHSARQALALASQWFFLLQPAVD